MEHGARVVIRIDVREKVLDRLGRLRWIELDRERAVIRNNIDDGVSHDF